MEKYKLSNEQRKMKDESIFEYMMHKLKEIQKEKIWGDEKMGFAFAELLTNEPKQIVV